MNTNNKNELIEHIKIWVKADEEIKEIQKVLKEKRETKKEESEYLIEIMKKNQIDCFNLNEGKLVHTQTKTKQSISKKFLLKTLNEYYQEENKAEEMTEYILKTREENLKEVLKKKK